MRQIIAVAIFLASVSASHGEFSEEDIAKMWRCNNSPDKLIGLSSVELHARCGRALWSHMIANAQGKSEQVIYGVSGRVVFYVYLVNNIVTAVQSE